jgi:hypothetical protein
VAVGRASVIAGMGVAVGIGGRAFGVRVRVARFLCGVRGNGARDPGACDRRARRVVEVDNHLTPTRLDWRGSQCECDGVPVDGLP